MCRLSLSPLPCWSFHYRRSHFPATDSGDDDNDRLDNGVDAWLRRYAEIRLLLLLVPKFVLGLVVIAVTLAHVAWKLVTSPAKWIYACRLARVVWTQSRTKEYLRPPSLRAIVEQKGYCFEEHIATTKDGFLLAVHRIRATTTSRNNILSIDDDEEEEEEEVVFLQHGMKCCSADWVTGSGLAVELARRGYDVWLGNFRGNIFSSRHRSLKPDEKRYWDFTFDHHGKYDLPAMLDLVRERTGCDRLRYVGHSMGTTALFVMLHREPYRNHHISRITVMAPVTHIRRFSRVPYLYVPTALFASIAYRAATGGWSNFNSPRRIPFYPLFAVAVLHYVGWNHVDPDLLKDVLYFSPGSTSTLALQQYIDCHVAEGFYSSDGNIAYDLSRVRRPVDIFWSPGDWASGTQDAFATASQLTNCPRLRLVHAVPDVDLGHLDFVFSSKAAACFDDLIQGIH